jgi:hypothetical protein
MCSKDFALLPWRAVAGNSHWCWMIAFRAPDAWLVFPGYRR